VTRPGDVGEGVDQLSRIGPDPVPLGDGLETGLYEVGLRAVPHDGGDGRSQPVAGRRRRYLRIWRPWSDKRHTGAPPRLGWLRPERHSALGDADARPACKPAFRGLLEVVGVDGEEEYVVPEDDPPPTVGGAVDLAYHASTEVADAEASAFVSEDDPVVDVVDAMLDHGRGNEAGPQPPLLEPAYALLQYRKGKENQTRLANVINPFLLL
jgi:hypothetical protein